MTRPKIRRGRRWRRLIKQLVTSILKIILFIVAISTQLQSGCNGEWQTDDHDDETFVREKVGYRIFSVPEYTPYTSTPIYSQEQNFSYLGMTPIHNFTHMLLGKDPDVARDYIVMGDDLNTLTFAPNVDNNSWGDLLGYNKLLLVFLLFILLIIILIPFLAVCYFCFCCCRCPPVCPPCVRSAKRRCCSILLLLLILGVLFGLLIAFLNDKLIERGFQHTVENTQRNAEDTCAFLQDVCNHVKHLFIHNFQEMETHLTTQLHEADTNMFLDLSDSSGLYALTELETILKNMPAALRLMKEADEAKTSANFQIAQYRDGLRGSKRDLAYILTVWCDYADCNNFLRYKGVLSMDTSKCLHVDKIPNITAFVEAIQEIIKQELVLLPQLGMKRLKEVSAQIEESVKPHIPPLAKRLEKLSYIFQQQSTKICNIVNAKMSEIYFENARSTANFNDFKSRFSHDRKIISLLVMCLILLIVIILIFALICGLCVRRDNSGSNCLILAIVLIFLVLSFILLVSLFYLVIGLLMYHGTCVPRSDDERLALFYPVARMTSSNDSMFDQPSKRELRRVCQGNETIFDLLRELKLYDIDTLRSKSGTDSSNTPAAFLGDISKVKILTDEEVLKLHDARSGNLSTYHSRLTTPHLCSVLSPINVQQMRTDYYRFTINFFYQWHNIPMRRRLYFAYRSAWRLGLDLDNYISMEPKVKESIAKLRTKVVQIDSLITRSNKDFNNTIKPLMDQIEKAEKFMQSKGSIFITSLLENLTESTKDEIEKYIEYVIDQCKTRVGPCRPLSYMYQKNIDSTCENLVNPINGFWLGLLICCLFLLPLLFVAHRLICLFKVYPHGLVIFHMHKDNCPTCTGAPYEPSPIVICGGGEQADCPCSDDVKEKSA